MSLSIASRIYPPNPSRDFDSRRFPHAKIHAIAWFLNTIGPLRNYPKAASSGPALHAGEPNSCTCDRTWTSRKYEEMSTHD
jgi:hypothetical protein